MAELTYVIAIDVRIKNRQVENLLLVDFIEYRKNKES